LQGGEFGEKLTTPKGGGISKQGISREGGKLETNDVHKKNSRQEKRMEMMGKDLCSKKKGGKGLSSKKEWAKRGEKKFQQWHYERGIKKGEAGKKKKRVLEKIKKNAGGILKKKNSGPRPGVNVRSEKKSNEGGKYGHG